MKKTIFILTLFSLLASTLPIMASETRAGEEVRITKPVEENLYIAAGEMRVEAPIGGDLVAAGGKVWVTDTIGDDATIFGGELYIRNVVKGDVRVAGGKVRISNEVLGDLIIFGGELTVESDATIRGDVKIFGGSVHFSGTAQGDLQMYAGGIEFDGEAAKTVEIKAGEVEFNGTIRGKSTLAARELEVQPDARFFSDVEYWREAGELDLTGNLQNGATATFNEDLKFDTGVNENIWAKSIFWISVFRIISAALLIILLVSFFSSFFQKNTGNVKEKIGNYLGVGALFLIGTPIVAILAFATVVGIPVGIIMFSGYAIALTLAHSLTAVVATYELEKYLNREWSNGLTMVMAIGAFILLKLIGLLAFPGQLITFLLTAIAIGAVIQWLRQGWRRQDDAPKSTPSSSADDETETV